jgi:hypothetical protein
MSTRRNKSTASKIFENVIFLAEVFGDKADRDIPKIPVLEMAQCFDLTRSPLHHRYPHRRRNWPLWR